MDGRRYAVQKQELDSDMHWRKPSLFSYLLIFLAFGFSSLSNAIPPGPPDPGEETCRSGPITVQSISVSTPDSNGNYELNYLLATGSIFQPPHCIAVVVQQSKDGGAYSSVSYLGLPISFTGQDSGTYKYRVAAYFTGGSAYLNWTYSREVKVVRKPYPPGSISFSDNEGGIDRDGKFKLTWGAASRALKVTGYKVQQCKEGAEACTSSSGVWGQIYSKADINTRTIPVPKAGSSPLTNGRYQYRVCAYVTISGTTKCSNWRYSSSYITVNRKPDQVNVFSAPLDGETQKEEFELIWQAPTGRFDPIDKYEVRCSLNGTSLNPPVCGGLVEPATEGAAPPTRMQIKLPGGTEGEAKFWVRAHNSQGWVGEGPPKTVAVNIPLPTPTGVAITVPESSEYGEYKVSWSADDDVDDAPVTEWKLQRLCKAGEATCGEGNSGWHDITLPNKLQTSYSPNGDVADEYHYQVQACNGSSCSAWYASPPIKVHNLENLVSVVPLMPATTPGNMDYSTDVTAQGDAVISVPVEPAPGVNGLVPNINIRYSGARYRERKNQVLPMDTLGWGWRLSGFGEIRRCAKGKPYIGRVQLDDRDRLCLNGERLVLVSGDYWAENSRYRTELDSFNLVELRVNADGKQWFHVSTPDGRIQEYGNTEESRLKVGTSVEFGWSLNKVTDAFGNSIEYSYHLDTVEGINYPLEITYGNNGDAKITFEYGTRTDAPPQPLIPEDIQQGQLVLLYRIKVELENTQIREYRLISEDEGEVENYRRLSYIQLCAGGECLHPLAFEWLEPDGGNPDVEFKTGVGQVTDGLGGITQFYHAMIRDNSDDGQFSERPFGEGMIPEDAGLLEDEGGKYRCVVSEVWRSNGLADGWHKTSYAYQGTGVMGKYHRGFLGYYAQRVVDEESGIVTYRQFRLDFPHIGKVAREVQYDAKYLQHTQVLAKRQFRYDDNLIAVGNTIQTSHYPTLSESLETIYEQNEILGYRFTSNQYSVKSYGSSGELVDGVVHTEKTATAATVPTSQDYWGEVKKTTSVSSVERSSVTTTSFNNRVDGNWLIGFVEGKDVRRYRGDTNPELLDQAQTMTAIPWPGSNKPATVTRFPKDPLLELEVNYTYDTYGNLLTETTSGADITTRVTEASGYETRDNRYPATVTNAEGHVVKATYDPRFGSPATVSDPDSETRITIIEYDPFGRETSRTNTDGVTFSTNYDFCLWVSECPVSGVYRIQTSSAITPAVDRYYDLLGRLVQQDTVSFTGTTSSRREFAYDSRGNLFSETAPFFKDEPSSKSTTTYLYDIRNRLSQVDRADGSQKRIEYKALASTHQIEQRIEEDIYEQVDGSSSITFVETQKKINLLGLTGDLDQTTDAAESTDAVTTEYIYYGTGLAKEVTINGDPGTTSSFHYDNAGNRDSLTDPNLGTVATAYNALGQLVGQTDNKGQFTQYVYDKLGRLRFQADGDGVAEWRYDPLNATGALDRRSYSEGATLVGEQISGGQEVFAEQYVYTGGGKLDTTATQLSGGGLNKTYDHDYDYDPVTGRLNQVIYPGGIEAHYVYNDRNYLWKITDGINPYKTFNEVNAYGQAEEEVYGNGVITNRTYNADTGRLESITAETEDASTPNNIQNNEYLWRSNGTLQSRKVKNGEQLVQQEDFTYDSLNRLGTASLSVGGNRTLTTLYDELGNITSKISSHTGDTDVTGYAYGDANSNAGPNAVSSVNIGGKSYTLHYDDNGAITYYDAASGDDKWITWNARQLPTEIVVGESKDTLEPTARDRFRYGPNGQRYYRETSWWDETENKLQTEKAFIVGSYEELLPANDPDYESIKKVRIESNVLHIAATDHAGITVDTLEYLHRDHLGSIEKITDKDGNLLIGAASELAFDPYGGRRKADWNGELSEQEVEELLNGAGLSTRRGFTGHEHLDRTGLIHMNGRIYDPALGRFLSPDPFVQAPTFSQNWNRYSYVVNNPLSFTDPSGYLIFVGCKGYADENGDVVSKPCDDGGGGGGIPRQPRPRNDRDHGGDTHDFPRAPMPAAPAPGGGQGGDTESAKEQANQEPSCDEINDGCVTVTADKDGNYSYPHEDPLGVGSLLSTLMGVSFMGERTFLGKGWQRIPRAPITHEKMLIHNYAAKAKISGVLKVGGNALGTVGYGVSLYEYGDSMQSGNYRGARKAGVDMYMGALMFVWPVGTGVGAVGLYVNYSYHSDPDNP